MGTRHWWLARWQDPSDRPPETAKRQAIKTSQMDERATVPGPICVQLLRPRLRLRLSMKTLLLGLPGPVKASVMPRTRALGSRSRPMTSGRLSTRGFLGDTSFFRCAWVAPTSTSLSVCRVKAARRHCSEDDLRMSQERRVILCCPPSPGSAGPYRIGQTVGDMGRCGSDQVHHLADIFGACRADLYPRAHGIGDRFLVANHRIES